MIKKVLVLCDASKHDWTGYCAYKISDYLQKKGEDVLLIDLRLPDAKDKFEIVDNVNILPKCVLSFEGAGFGILSINDSLWIDIIGSRVFAFFSKHPITNQTIKQ